MSIKFVKSLQSYFASQIKDKGCLVKFVEPMYSLNMNESHTAYQILDLVSSVEKIETDNPITVVSRFNL